MRSPLSFHSLHRDCLFREAADARKVWQTRLLRASPTDAYTSIPQMLRASCVGWLLAVSDDSCCHRLLVSGRTGVFEGDIRTGSMPAQGVHQLRRSACELTCMSLGKEHRG